MFIGRNFELEQLNKLYTRGGFQLAIIYGRRKVGKTALIKEFSKDKPNLYYIPEEHNELLAFKSFKELILGYFDIRDNETSIENWEEAFKAIAEKSGNKKLVLILDEFSYIAEENPSLPSIIQRTIEHSMQSSEIFLIISGSSKGFMEKQLLSPKSALYGLRSAQFKIESFNFFESCEFYPKASIFDKINYYSTLGGTPQYLLQFDYGKSYESNVKEFTLNKSSYLYNEPESYLKSHIEDIDFANDILSLLAKGDFNLERFHNKNIQKGEDLILMIKKLRELNLISRRRSEGRSIIRPWSFYRLDDNFFRYWYKFIHKNRNLIQMNMTDYLFENKIRRDLNSHIGYVFEEICSDFLKKLNAEYKLPFVFESIGSWVGYNPVLRKPSQLDIVATSFENVLVGECKWSGSPINVSIIESLLEKSKTLKYTNKFYCLFSRCGYDKEALNYAKDNKNITLYTLKDIENLI